MAKRTPGGVLSYPTASHVLFDEINYGETILILYNKSDCHKQVFRNLVAATGDTGTLVNYISHRKNRFSSEEPYAGYTFNKVNNRTLRRIKSHIDSHFNEIEERGKKSIVLVDWAQGRVGECSLFLPFLEEFVQRCRSCSLSNWQKLKGKKGGRRVILVNAFDASQVSAGLISKAIGLHERTILLEEGHSTALLPKASSSWKKVSPNLQVLPLPLLERVLKTHLEFVVLLLLEKEDKSGFQMIREISASFHCLISQGTLYPLLYRMEREGKIIRRDGKGREVIYSLGPGAEEALQSSKEHMLNAISHFAGVISASGKTRPDTGETETQTSLPVFAADPKALNLRS